MQLSFCKQEKIQLDSVIAKSATTDIVVFPKMEITTQNTDCFHFGNSSIEVTEKSLATAEV